MNDKPKDTEKRGHMSKIVLFSIGLAGIGLLTVLFGPEAVGSVLAGVSPKAIAVLFILQLSTLMASAWIWYFLLNRESRISFSAVFLINQAAGLVESLTPSVKFGGEAAKVYLFRRETRQSVHRLAGILLVHKFLTLAPFALLCVVVFLPALYFFELPRAVTISLFFLLAACGGLYWICYRAGADRTGCPEAEARPDNDSGQLFSRLFQSASARLIQAAAFLHQARISAATLLSNRETMGVFAVSLAIWLFYPVKVYLACTFLGLTVHPLIIGLATLFAYMVSMAPLSPGGLGTYEGTMALFFTIGGMSPAEGLAVSILSRFVTFWFPLFLSGFAFLVLLWRKRLLPVSAGIRRPDGCGHPKPIEK